MKKWLRRLRGAVGMGLTWAAAWFGVGAIILSAIVVFGGAPAGIGLVEVFANSVPLAVAGFLGGAAFSGVLTIAEGRRRFDEVSLPRFAASGAVGGLLLSVLLLSISGPLSLTNVVVAGVVTLLSAGSAAGSAALARRAEDRELLEAGEEALSLLEAESAQ